MSTAASCSSGWIIISEMVPGLYFDPKANASSQIQNSFRRDFGRDLLSGDSGTIGRVQFNLLAGSTGEATPPREGRPGNLAAHCCGYVAEQIWSKVLVE